MKIFDPIFDKELLGKIVQENQELFLGLPPRKEFWTNRELLSFFMVQRTTLNSVMLDHVNTLNILGCHCQKGKSNLASILAQAEGSEYSFTYELVTSRGWLLNKVGTLFISQFGNYRYPTSEKINQFRAVIYKYIPEWRELKKKLAQKEKEKERDKMIKVCSDELYDQNFNLALLEEIKNNRDLLEFIFRVICRKNYFLSKLNELEGKSEEEK